MARRLWLELDSGRNSGQDIRDIHRRDDRITIINGIAHELRCGVFNFGKPRDLDGIETLTLQVRNSQTDHLAPVVSKTYTLPTSNDLITRSAWNNELDFNFQFALSDTDLDLTMLEDEETYWLVLVGEFNSGQADILGASEVTWVASNSTTAMAATSTFYFDHAVSAGTATGTVPFPDAPLDAVPDVGFDIETVSGEKLAGNVIAGTTTVNQFQFQLTSGSHTGCTLRVRYTLTN